MPEGSAGALLGIDFGKRSVGLAVGHRLTGSARPLDPIRYRDTDALHQQLIQVIERWRPGQIVVGLPLSGEGSETDMSRQVRQFADRLARECPDVGIELHDERLTSHAAAGQLASRRRSGQARRRESARLDSMAAALILESWMADND